MPSPRLVASSGSAASPSSGFAASGLTGSLVTAVTALGYEEMTPVQRATIPLLLAGKDMLAQAATGTGKTAAFALPMLHRLLGHAKGGRRRIRGLVLVPTRELAMQVAEAIHKYARGTALSVVPVYGGASMIQQLRALERGADIVVATPGRALDHLKRGSLALGDVEMLVLDEADEMLDMGFADDLDAILEATPGRAADRAVLRHDAAAHPVDRAAAPDLARADHRSRARRPRPASCRACGRSRTSWRGRTSGWRSSACSTARTPPRRWSSAGRGSRWTRWSRR
jgi:superfamily II DNA/RNA helicase